VLVLPAEASDPSLSWGFEDWSLHHFPINSAVALMLRTVGRQYAAFWQVTQEALLFSWKSLSLELSKADSDRPMQSYSKHLRRAGVAWSDAKPFPDS
jgi:hypothetical protein